MKTRPQLPYQVQTPTSEIRQDLDVREVSEWKASCWLGTHHHPFLFLKADKIQLSLSLSLSLSVVYKSRLNIIGAW
jgi:hypothetical protein